ARADHAARHDPHDGRLLPAVRRAVRDDARRPGAEHHERPLLHVRGRLQVVEPRVRVGGRVRAVRDHARRHAAAALRRPPVAYAVSRRTEVWLINGALVAASLIALFPLLWMISVSLMASGESSTAPAPLVPADPTLASYRE